MSLPILNVAYPPATVSPNAVGGAEQVVSTQKRAVVEAGTRSLVGAAEGSTCAGLLLPLPLPPGDLASHAMWDFHCEAVRGLLDRGTAHLYILRVNGTPETFDSRVATLRSTAQPVASRTETVDVPH